MLLLDDDSACNVDSHWLGPPGCTFLWVARYSAYGTGAVLFAAGMLMEGLLGVPLNVFSTLVLLALVVFLTRTVGRRVGFEVRVQHLIVIGWHEITTPRAVRPWTAVFHMRPVAARRRVFRRRLVAV